MTGFQYDILSTTEQGYPYLETPVLSGEEFNDNFVFQNNFEHIENLKISDRNQVGSFPTSTWVMIKDLTIKEVKNLLKL